MQGVARRFYRHQRRAFRYALQAPHPALWMEMRLGKTLVTLRRCLLYRPLDARVGLRVLVVAPMSALGSWKRECEAEGIVSCWLTGTKRQRQEALMLAFGLYDAGGMGAVVANRMVCLINREGWRALPEIANMTWDAVIADESTFLKSPRARVTKFFLKHFRDVPHRWCLSGTPNPEGDDDFVCQMLFLRGTAFGCSNYWQFRARYMRPHPWYRGQWVMHEGARRRVRETVARECLVMRRQDVGLREVKVRERREIEMPPALRKAYRKLEREFVLEHGGVEKTTLWAGARWQWLRQMTSGFIEERLVWDGKVACVLDLLRGELKRERVVVWCSYNAEVEAIEAALLAAKIDARGITGAVKPDERDFSFKTTQVLVLQQEIAQTGMDLSDSDTAIYVSTPPGCMARLQTEDRILSVDKARRKVPLLYVDLVVPGTVDQDLLDLVTDKRLRSQATLRRALMMAMERRTTWTRDG